LHLISQTANLGYLINYDWFIGDMVTIYLVAILLEKAVGSQRTETAKDEDLLPLRVTASVKILLLRVCPHDTVVQFQYVHSLKLRNEATVLADIARV